MSTKYNGTKQEKDSLDAFIKVVRANETVVSKISLFLSKHKLTISQFGILDAILHNGPLSQTSLGEKILKSGGNITHVVDNLEKRGLVKRKRNEKDRRNFEINLTSRGSKLISKVLPLIVKLITKEFSVFNKKELEQFQFLCKKLGIQNRS